MHVIDESPKPEKGKPGRPKIEIDWELVQKLAHIQCTQAEIASTVGVSVDTLHRHPEFAEVYKRGAEGGRKSLRRMQFESATKGNVVMQIWLGKQYLGQADKQLVDTRVVRGLTDLTDEELQNLIGEAKAAAGIEVTAQEVSADREAQEPQREPLLIASAQQPIDQ
jgi:hypothetical protein